MLPSDPGTIPPGCWCVETIIIMPHPHGVMQAGMWARLSDTPVLSPGGSVQILIPLPYLHPGHSPLPKSPGPGDEAPSAARVLWGEHQGGPRTST